MTELLHIYFHLCKCSTAHYFVCTSSVVKHVKCCAFAGQLENPQDLTVMMLNLAADTFDINQRRILLLSDVRHRVVVNGYVSSYIFLWQMPDKLL